MPSLDVATQIITPNAGQTVADLDESIRPCVELGGRVINGPRKAGQQRYCVIQDPAGAVCALSSES